jgi:voltage-gated potassium channel
MNRKRVYEIVEVAAPGDRASRAFDLSIMGLIFLNVVALVLYSYDPLREAANWAFTAFELFSVGVFSIEYALRLWACTADPRYAQPVRGRLRWMASPMAIIDMLAILPTYINLLTPATVQGFLALRTLRLLRLFKMGRYSKSLKLLARVLKRRRRELLITLSLIGLLLVVASALLYYAEKDEPKTKFTSIFESMWWAVVTLTTVGYGDVSPQTVMGKLLGGLVAMIGVAMIALPTGILGGAFMEELMAPQPAANGAAGANGLPLRRRRRPASCTVHVRRRFPPRGR